MSLQQTPPAQLLAPQPSTFRRLTKKKSVLISAIIALTSKASTFFDWGIRFVDWLQRYDYIAGRDTKSYKLLALMFSPRGSEFIFWLALAAFFIAVMLVLTPKGQVRVLLAEQDLSSRQTAHADSAASSETQAPSPRSIAAANAEPNFVCTSTDPRPAMIMRASITEGLDPYSSGQAGAIVAEISNEFLSSRAVGNAKLVSAEIVYQPANGRTVKVKRGSWLNGITYQRTFTVNDSYRLIIAFFRENNPHAFMITREAASWEDALENRVAVLENDLYQIKVRLISEDERKVYKEFDFSLTITREPELGIELAEVRELTSKEIRQQLELFLNEGNEILRDFPKGKEKTPADDEKINNWDKKIIGFLNQYPDKFSIAIYTSVIPVVQFHGTAHSGNWTSLNKLTTRIARLNDLISEFRKG